MLARPPRVQAILADGHAGSRAMVSGRCRCPIRSDWIVVATSDQGLDLDARVGDRLQPAPGILLKAAVEQPSQPGWTAGGSSPQSGSVLRIDASVSVAVSPLNGRLPGNHLEEHDTESPDVGTLVDGVPPRLLRAHVGGGAHDERLTRSRRAPCRVPASGRPLRRSSRRIWPGRSREP